MAIVKCKFCGNSFDREKLPFILIPAGKVNRYAHPDCYKEAVKNKLIDDGLELIHPDETIQCFYCMKFIKKNKDSYVEVVPGKFAHVACVAEMNKTGKSDAQKLEEYIIGLFDLPYLTPGLRKQINSYVENKNYSYSGILSSLKYFYEIRKNPVDKAKPTLGIVPYIYEAARQYYYRIWLANQNNAGIDLSKTVEKVEVTITPQKREPLKKRKFFSIDEDEVIE